ncbi:hypothetical protein GIB67_015352 [Kingdonia uniflora]|uniref:Uncharacterized protein n=1 Tax=Kingdonia uniflora TaxID=39325 RepID=A0A7J7KYS4_9MAGN|nr:hypothetical protein GIB67_015352 [Kingdonia uniflora]
MRFFLRGKQIYHAPKEFSGNDLHVIAVYDAGQQISKVVEDANSIILKFESDDLRRTWQNRVQGAIYRASVLYTFTPFDFSCIIYTIKKNDRVLNVVVSDININRDIFVIYNSLTDHHSMDKCDEGAAPITALSETSSDSGDSELEYVDNSDSMNLVTMEKVFVTGVLDELKICFSYNNGVNQDFMTMLLSEERRLFEFRAIGGQVELSMRGNDMFIGTVLKSLEIEDLVSCEGMTRPHYLARSFFKNTDVSTSDEPSSFYDVGQLSYNSNELTQSEGEDNFFEASEDLVDPPGSSSEYLSSQNSLPPGNPTTQPPKFVRIANLLPDSEHHLGDEEMELNNILDSFVKAQIVIYDQNSPQYNNMDMRVAPSFSVLQTTAITSSHFLVTSLNPQWLFIYFLIFFFCLQVKVTLATLSFFCHRPTIPAILEFVNAINVDDDKKSSATTSQPDIDSEDLINNQHSSATQEPTIKGLLGKGKSRVIFYLTLKMVRAQILLMNENGTQLATLSQDNFLSDIKVLLDLSLRPWRTIEFTVRSVSVRMWFLSAQVFPSSFSIKASLGNLKISDDSLHNKHQYFWVCDMRNPGGSSFVEVFFTNACF